MDTKTKVTIKVKPKSKQKCVRCKHILKYPEDFVSPRTGKPIKTCMFCIDKNRCIHNRDKAHCKECKGSQICRHNRERSKCKECGGISICPHNKQRPVCKECGGSQICKHNRRRHICKDCKGGSICNHNRERSTCKICSDTFTVIAKQWIHTRRTDDKKKNRDHDLTLEFCMELLNTIQNCVYCDTPFTYEGRHDDTYVTIQRLDNELGHTIDNCTLCCRICNSLDGAMYSHSKKS